MNMNIEYEDTTIEGEYLQCIPLIEAAIVRAYTRRITEERRWKDRER